MENISRQIGTKFDLATQIADKLGDIDPDAATSFRIEAEALRARYILSTAHLFLEGMGGGAARRAARDELSRIIAAEGFMGELDLLVGRVRRGLGGGAPRTALRDVRMAIEQYERQTIDCARQAVETACNSASGYSFNVCDECAVEMTVDVDTAELTCPRCSRARALDGTVFDDAQFYNQEGQKAKSGSFNPNRHYLLWITHIQAQEPEEEIGDKEDPENNYGEKLLEGMRQLIVKDRKVLRLLTIDDFRRLLQRLGRTDLNKNLPLIMKKMTGIAPPQLPEHYLQKAARIFMKAIAIDEKLRCLDNPNRSYYPYYIYKIFDGILPADDMENRRILCYIYLQGDDTLDKNDTRWQRICGELPEIVWRKTDRSQAQKYRML